MLFALLGIPMGLIMFQSIGERVNTFIAYIVGTVRPNCTNLSAAQVERRSTGTRHQFSGRDHAKASNICLTLHRNLYYSTGYVQEKKQWNPLGTWVFHREEQWSIFDAYYYCFITLSTVGFGDFLPLQQRGDLQERPGYVVFNLLFIIVGLAVFSACVNLLVLG